MQRYFIKISYKGTAYHGWQVQQNANSVQAELDNALKTVFEEPIETVGCGRTDTGVHAREFYAHFDAEREDLEDQYWKFKLNSFLSQDIVCHKIYKVPADAHARFDAISRTYKYYITRERNPFLTDRAYYLYGSLNLEKIKEATKILFDYTEFSCFSKSRTQVKTDICKIMQAEWEEKDNQIIFTITADRFLRNMVRAITGTLIEVGRKKISSDDLRNIIEGKSRSAAGASVPALGLFLEKVIYPEGLINE
jgi:tRNA pseudouridine38-40 synthase